MYMALVWNQLYVKFDKAGKVLIGLQFKYLLYFLKQIIWMIEN